jgi:myosin heavy subunit
MEEQFKPVGKENNNTRIYIIVIIVLALGLISVFIWQNRTSHNLNALLAEKEEQRVEFKNELDSLMIQHDKIKTEYGQLSDSLSSKDSIIQSNAIEIKKLLNTKWEYYKVKKKLSQLQTIAQGYVRQMDSLYTVNKALTEENITIKKEVKELKQEKAKVDKTNNELNEKVEIAAFLQAYNMKATGIRQKSGGNKEVDTDKARKVDQLKVCFTLAENQITSPGPKDIYVRIARPDKEILTRSKLDEYTFEYQGKMIQYSIKQGVNYENKPIDLCLYWRKNFSGQEMPTGLYNVDIFCDGAVIGHTTFSLR